MIVPTSQWYTHATNFPPEPSLAFLAVALMSWPKKCNWQRGNYDIVDKQIYYIHARSAGRGLDWKEEEYIQWGYFGVFVSSENAHWTTLSPWSHARWDIMLSKTSRVVLILKSNQLSLKLLLLPSSTASSMHMATHWSICNSPQVAWDVIQPFCGK